MKNFTLQSFCTPLSVSRLANIHYFEFTKEYQTFDDSHNFCELLYVDKGSIIVESENYSGTLTDNQMIIHRANEKHSLKCTDASCPNVIIIGFECTCPELDTIACIPIKLMQAHKKMLSDIMKEGMNVYAPPYDIPNTLEMKKRESYPFASDQMLKLNLEAFLITMIRERLQSTALTINSPLQGGKMSDICNYINEHYTEKISLDDICFLFGTNKTTLCHRFKEEYGVTISEYINRLKIRAAKALIREQNMSVTEISDKLGFASIHYFCRLFKKHTALSPTQYSKTIKSKLNL